MCAAAPGNFCIRCVCGRVFLFFGGLGLQETESVHVQCGALCGKTCLLLPVGVALARKALNAWLTADSCMLMRGWCFGSSSTCVGQQATDLPACMFEA
jgi:hypothetical protein